MQHDRDRKTPEQSQSDLNSSNFSATQSDAMRTFLEQCLAQECVQKTNLRSKSILFVVLTILALVSVAAHRTQISQAISEIPLNVAEELKVMVFN